MRETAIVYCFPQGHVQSYFSETVHAVSKKLQSLCKKIPIGGLERDLPPIGDLSKKVVLVGKEFGIQVTTPAQLDRSTKEKNQ